MAWVRGSDSRPMAARWQEVASELIAHGGNPISPISEQNIYDMQIELSRKRPPIVDDQAVRVAGRELFDLRHRYQRSVLRVVQLQGRLASCANDPIHRLLNDVPHEWAVDLPREIADTPYNATAGEVRRAVGQAAPRVLAVEALQNSTRASAQRR